MYEPINDRDNESVNTESKNMKAKFVLTYLPRRVNAESQLSTL
jgi:hypothetical protein